MPNPKHLRRLVVVLVIGLFICSDLACAQSDDVSVVGNLGLLRSDRYRHPFYWAGFVMVGDGW